MESIIVASFSETANLKAMMDAQMIGLLKQGANSTPQGANLRFLDPDTDFKVRRLTLKVNEGLHLLANEPSLGLYWIQEHVHRTLPNLIQKKKELAAVTKTLEGVSYDVDDSITVTESLSGIKQFTRIGEALKSAIEMKKGLVLKEKKLLTLAHMQSVTKNGGEEEAAMARKANQSISQNELAEGYICPVCYFALECQDALIVHWLQNHNGPITQNEATDPQISLLINEQQIEAQDPETAIAKEAVQECQTPEADSQDIWVIHRVQSTEEIQNGTSYKGQKTQTESGDG